MTALRWAAKRIPNTGVAMVVSMDSQSTSSRDLHALDVETVIAMVKKDDKHEVIACISEWGEDNLWQSWRKGSHIKNCLHISAERGALTCLAALLDYSPPKKVIDAPDHEGKTPLMIAVTKAHFEAAKLLINHGANVNSRGNRGQSALHIIGKNMIPYGSQSKALLKITDLILSHSDIHLESHDENCLTPLATAIKKCDEEDLKVIADLLLSQPDNSLDLNNDSHLTQTSLSQNDEAPRTGGLVSFCSRLVNKGASMTASITTSRTIEEVLHSKKTLTKIAKDQKQKSAPPKLSSSEFLDMIILGKNVEKIQQFLNEKDENGKGHNATDFNLGSYSLLFYAIDKINKPLVEVLLKAGANPLVPEITGELPIYRAAARGHYDIFNLVIQNMKDDEGIVDIQKYSFRILQKLIENSKNQKEISEDINYSKCLSRLFEKDVIIDVNQEEDDETILHVAAAFSNQEALTKLLQHGAFLGAHRKEIDRDYGNILPCLLPETLERAMDGCISYQPSTEEYFETENILNDEYTLKLDYRFLVSPVNKDDKQKPKKVNELKTLREISRSKRHRPVIMHPLVQALLFAKWHKAYTLYITNVFIYFLFSSLLTKFVYTVKDLRLLEESKNNTSNSSLSNSTVSEDSDNLQMTANVLMGFLVLLTLYMLIREIVQIAIDYKVYYRNVENYLEWFLIIVVFILCVTPLDLTFTRHLTAWAMIVAWYEFVLILGRASPLTIYITMLRHVSWTFGKFTIVYGFLILAFTFSFNIILQPTEHTDFSDFWSTLPKMIVMATGEFEYSDLSDKYSQKVVFHFVFVTFLFFIFLILMNVMIGLAVTDTQKIVDDAKLHSLTSRLELLYLAEVIVLAYYQRMPFVLARFESLVNKFQLLTRDHDPHSNDLTSPFRVKNPHHSKDLNQSMLFVKVNKPNEKNPGEGFINLNKETAECLRSHHIRHLEEETRKRNGDSMN